MARYVIAKYVAISPLFLTVTLRIKRVLNYYKLLDDVLKPSIKIHTSYAPNVHHDVTSGVRHSIAGARAFSAPLPHCLSESLPECERPAPAFLLNALGNKRGRRHENSISASCKQKVVQATTMECHINHPNGAGPGTLRQCKRYSFPF
jgi:hypothetical protein